MYHQEGSLKIYLKVTLLRCLSLEYYLSDQNCTNSCQGGEGLEGWGSGGLELLVKSGKDSLSIQGDNPGPLTPWEKIDGLYSTEIYNHSHLEF